MTSVSLLQICCISACSNALLLRNAHPLNVNKALVTANRRSTSLSGRQRHHRRHNSYSPSLTTTPYRRRRTASFIYWPESLQKAPRSFPSTPRRRKEAARQRPQEMVDLRNSLDGVMLAPTPVQGPSAANSGGRVQDESITDRPRMSEEVVPPSPSVNGDDSFIETRSIRSGSVASRSSNRLSLTIPIPIALPTAPSSRPTPTSSHMASYPPTPLDTPSIMSPVDPSDFITAIAAQERRVLELREELSRAESELNNLKKHWARSEAHKKHAQIRNVEPLRPLVPHIDTPDDPSTRRSVELDRRKQLLLGQQSQQGTPTHQYRRRVFRGGHTRTLSLLSPTKPTGGGFDVHEDDATTTTTTRLPEAWKPARRETDSPSGTGYTTIYPTPSKRASWAPRSAHQQTSGVKQIAEDLKTGLWTFMEDLRQATVGDEPITGQGTYLRGIDGNMRSTSASSSRNDRDENQETIRASVSSARPHASSVFDYADETPTPASRFVDRDDKEKENAERPGAVRQTSSSTSQKMSALSAKNQKRFSWTPLTIDSYDDNDWSNWESPSAVKSPRWSGSTMNGDIITEGGSAGDDRDSLTPDTSASASNSSTNGKRTPSPKKNPSASRLRDAQPPPSSPSASSNNNNMIEDLLPPVLLNRLTPSNLKKTASDFMKEWERSLSSPPPQSQDLAGGGSG